jgi:UDP-N-acetylmuramyl pentapeptide synthase
MISELRISRYSLPLSLVQLHKIVGGRLRLGRMPPRDGELTAVGEIVTDSRLVNAGDVFWALKGATHDGSHFAEDALARGASGVVTAGRWIAPWAGGWSLEVDDSNAALRRLVQSNVGYCRTPNPVVGLVRSRCSLREDSATHPPG